MLGIQRSNSWAICIHYIYNHLLNEDIITKLTINIKYDKSKITFFSTACCLFSVK